MLLVAEAIVVVEEEISLMFFQIAEKFQRNSEVKKTIIMEIILWDFSMFYHIFFSLGMKQRAFISNKQGVYELPHKLLHELRFRILGNKKKSGKSQHF